MCSGIPRSLLDANPIITVSNPTCRSVARLLFVMRCSAKLRAHMKLVKCVPPKQPGCWRVSSPPSRPPYYLLPLAARSWLRYY